MTDKKTQIDPITHDDQRVNIPTPELAPMMDPDDARPIKVAYEQRNPDLDPQLIWRGKDIDQTEITVDAPPIYLQEQVHPKAIIEDLRAGGQRNGQGGGADLFDHFGITDDDREAEIEFYRHQKKWSNRMILGDGLQVMASLAEREGLKGQVQAIYIDPPYGIKFNSNFQWSTASRSVEDGKLEHLTREPEQVKAFRDTWRDGIHSYLQYLRDRLVVARELLTESGSCFVQIGDENVHRVRALMDEVFGEDNFVSLITVTKTGGQTSRYLAGVADYVVWFAKNADNAKFRRPLQVKEFGGDGAAKYRLIEFPDGHRLHVSQVPDFDPGSQEFRVFRKDTITSPKPPGNYPVRMGGIRFNPGSNFWKTSETGMERLLKARRLEQEGKRVAYVRYLNDYGAFERGNVWNDLGGIQSRSDPKIYVVQSSSSLIQRCLLMTTDPGDLVLDPTCGSGTTAYVAEQWGRRWITIDTSRVALALARARIMGAKYPWYLLKDSDAGQKKEAEVTRSAPSTADTYNDIRHGFVYQRVPHITLKSIANNTEIDTIWEAMQPAVEEARAALNAALHGHPTPFEVETGGRKGKKIDFTASGEVELPSGEMAPTNGFMEWEIPREAPDGWPDAAKTALQDFWKARIARQKEIDASIAAKADHEYLYDKPYEDKKRVRVAGPFTVESLSPHRTQAVNEQGELIDEADAASGKRRAGEQEAENYRTAILENLSKAGVQQAGREDRIDFTSLSAWPGEWLAAEGRYMEGETERRAGILIGPEYGTLQRADLVAAAREAADAGFDLVIACAFNFDAHTAEFHKLGRITVLQARMNADLHMAGDLKAGGGNLFVVFGEPDIEIVEEGDKLRVRLLGVDIFRPATGEVSSSDPDEIACWFIDTDYDEQSFFVRHAYFPGAEIPYKQLKTTLKAEIDEEAWQSLKRTESRAFARPKSGRIAVKVINHLGDEVMKVIGV
ncbi:site-specific DNA-methyltransferase [Pacificitalea manganoxidans]|uniref:site-specific DNA-methyltransferase (adenine-specific) n=1 Tax=Pacificitalea manganoxidans TaxID=1411902 RepID=A0A291M018_9RHOB|nr:site-specific DNA-methyltransferase [Pacificitalea manganoxidans]ATI42065.1 site-specific DNA-methyltransferase [Pacificitalea manganoxidans]MDR6308138.1 adenine-specific DNA-methyltransferase [Pacificitalea manganoxidans]